MERLYCTINEEQARIAHDMIASLMEKSGSCSRINSAQLEK